MLVKARSMVSVRMRLPAIMATPSTMARAVSAARVRRSGEALEGDPGHRVTSDSASSTSAAVDGPCVRTMRAVGEEHDAVGDRRRRGVVGDHHRRLAVVVHRAAEQLEHLGAGAGVEVAGGLVGEHHGRAATASRGRWPRAAAGRPRARRAGGARRSPSPTEAITSSSHAPVDAAAGDARRQGDVLLGGEGRQQVEELEDEADVAAAELGEGVVAHRRDLRVADPDVARRWAGRGRPGCASGWTCRSPRGPSRRRARRARPRARRRGGRRPSRRPRRSGGRGRGPRRPGGAWCVPTAERRRSRGG